MVRFQLNTQRALAGLLEEAGVLHQLYAQKSHAFFSELEAFLNKAAAIFQQEKLLSQTSRMNTLGSNLVALRSDYDPYRYVRLDKDKRDTKYVIGLQIFKDGQEVLLNSYEQGEEKIAQATELLENLVLSFSQHLGKDISQFYRETCHEKPETLWHSMGIDPNFALYQKKVLLLVGYYDVLILLDQIVAASFGPQIKLSPL
jgi:hypothetical protein